MNNEEFERNIRFIVEHQAKFVSDIEALKERQAITQVQIEASQRHLTQLTANVNQLTINVNGPARMMGQHIGDANGHIQLEAEE